MPNVVVNCPKCSTQLRINRTTSSAVQFKCTQCGTLIKLSAQPSESPTASAPAPAPPTQAKPQNPTPTNPPAAGQPAGFPQAPVQPQTSVFDDLPGTGGAPAASRSFTPPPAKQLPRKKKNPAQSKKIVIGLVSVVGVAALVVGGYFLYQALPAGSIARLNPLGDSPAKVIDRLYGISTQCATELESIKDESSRDAAIKELNTLADEARELQRAAIMMGPVPESERNELVKQYNQKTEPLRDRLKAASTQVREKNLNTPELLEATLAIGFAISDVGMAMDVGWKEMPEPKNEFEELEHAVAIIERDIWRQLASVTTENQYRDVPQQLANVPDRYKELMTQQEELAKGDQSEKPRFPTYHDFTFGYGFQTASKLAQLKQDYGENSALDDVMQSISEATNDLRGVQIVADIAREEAESASRRGPGNRGPGFRGPGRSGPVSTGPGSTGPGRNPGFNPPKSQEEAVSRMIDQFVNRYGKEKSVILRINGGGDLRAQAGEIVDKVADIQATELGVKPKNFIAPRQGETTVIAFTYSGSLSEVTARIDFGEVVSTDTAKREIVVQK